MTSPVSGMSWSKCIIGPSINCPGLNGESQFWVEYDPRWTFQVLLEHMKASLGITLNVGLYLQGFYLPTNLTAALLLQAQEPLMLLPAGHTRLPFTSGVNQPNIPATPVYDAPDANRTFKPVQASTPIVGQENRVLSYTSTESKQIGYVSVPGTPESKSSAPVVYDTDNSEVVSPAAKINGSMSNGGVPAKKGRPRKLRNTELDSLQGGVLILSDNADATNSKGITKRVTRRSSNLTQVGNLESPGSKRASSPQDENVPPKRAKRLKSTDETEVNREKAVPRPAKPRVRKGKKTVEDFSDLMTIPPVAVMKDEVVSIVELSVEDTHKAGIEINLSSLPSFLGFQVAPDTPSKLSETQPTLQQLSSLETPETTPVKNYQSGAKMSASMMDTAEISCVSSVASNGYQADVSTVGSESQRLSDATDVFNSSENGCEATVYEVSIFGPLNNSEQVNPNVMSDLSNTMEASMSAVSTVSSTWDEIPIRSYQDIKSGDIIQAELLVMGVHGSPEIFVPIMKVIGTDGEQMSVIPPTALLEEGIDICQSFLVKFSDMIAPKKVLMTDTDFAAIGAHENPNMSELSSFDESML